MVFCPIFTDPICLCIEDRWEHDRSLSSHKVCPQAFKSQAFGFPFENLTTTYKIILIPKMLQSVRSVSVVQCHPQSIRAADRTMHVESVRNIELPMNILSYSRGWKCEHSNSGQFVTPARGHVLAHLSVICLGKHTLCVY